MIIDTKQHAAMKRILGVILMWATFEGGSKLDPKQVEALCRKALRKEVIKK